MMLRAAIEDILLEGVSKRHFPGSHYGVVRGDGTVFFGHVGYKQTSPFAIPVNGDEIYDVASLTKVIATTTMIMKLIDRGELRLDTEVTEILPRFHVPGITIVDLLTHSSGLPADIPRANTLTNRDDVLTHLYTVTPTYERGSNVVYSDIGFLLLGLVVEKITKKTLPEVAKQWIFDPLGMSDTSYAPLRERTAPTEYRNDNVYHGYLQGRVHDEKAFAMNGHAGHAGLFSTTRDIAKFLLMYLKGDPTVLKPATLDAMFVPRQLGKTASGAPIVRAYGFDKPTPGGTAGNLVDPANTILHTGFTGCNLWIDRAHQVAFVLLSNAVHPNRDNNGIIPYRRRLANVIMDAIQEESK